MNALIRCSLSAAVLAAGCLSNLAADLPVPEELIGKKTIAVASLDVENINKDQLSKTLKAALGDAFDPKSLEQLSDLQEKFKAAGGTTISFVYYMQKNTTAENAEKGEVLVVGKNANSKGAALAKLIT